MAIDFLHFDFVVSQGSLSSRVPVDQALTAVDQPIFEQSEECFADGFGAGFVHRKTLAVPVAGAAHRVELVGDTGFVFVFPGLDFFNEFITLKVGAAFAFFGQDAFFNDGLGGDAGVVGAGHPEGVAALHAMVANEDVLDGVVQSVAHVQSTGDVGRRDDDGVVALIAVGRGIGMEGLVGKPLVISLFFHLGRIVNCGHVEGHGCGFL